MTSNAVDSFRLAWQGKVNEIPDSQVQAVTGDSLLIRAGAAEALFTAPAGSTGCIAWWGISEQVETCYGRISQIVGLETDVAQHLAAGDPFQSGLLNVTEGQQVTRLVDFPLSYQTGITQIATYSIGPRESLTLFGQTAQYQRIDERIWMPELDYSALNQYWVDPATGQVRRSLQHPSPEFPVFEVISTHKHGKDAQE
ncbi:YjbF family lipoprotein [Halopseudomonas maritima]|uniref:YjbF family lipoprotein n=1 Tax=Halopseudomonas maritima TaxID=2918528 RepID=UPI001EECCE5F|nr:YjbF family lipoprotein [Halopseudomonas maritima]UJJ32064.1 YjbF family lipoprotein [Halopseudomonas maritima]